MPLADDLTKTEIKTDAAGRLLAVGLDAQGAVYLEMSDDGGLTRMGLRGGGERRLICGYAYDAPSIAVLDDGTLVVCATQSGRTKLFTSRDDGEHWHGV